MRITCFIVALLMSFCLSAETGAAKSTEASSDLVRVKGKGTGTTKEKALKDAYRDAVETAVGRFVDAEQLVDNDQLVNDQVLTHCNAYIDRYEEKKVTQHDGLIDVVIIAWVRRCELTRKLRDVMPTVTLNVSDINRNLYAQIVTQDKSDADAEKLLKRALDDFDPLARLMKVTVVNQKPKVSPSKESSDMKILSYQLKFEIDPDEYFKVWMPYMDRILSQISLSPAKSFSFNKINLPIGFWRTMEHSYDLDEKERTEYFSYDKWHVMDSFLLGKGKILYGQGFATGNYGECGQIGHQLCCIHDDLGFSSDKWNTQQGTIRRWGAIPKMKAQSKLYVALVRRVANKKCSGSLYELSERSAEVISTWMSRYAGLSEGSERCFDDTSARSTIYHLALKDESGAEISVSDCRAFNHDMSNIGCVCWGNDKSSDERDKPGNTIPYVVYMTPWVGCFASECSTWVDIEVNVGDIAKISTISITPEAAPKK